MIRINLKKVKDALNKIDDNELEKCFITHPYTTESSDINELMFVYFGEEENFGKFFDEYSESVEVMKQFSKGVFYDAKKIVSVILEVEDEDDYIDDIPGDD